MGSVLSTGTKRRQSPSWCKKGMWGGIPLLIAGLPATLVCYANWYQKLYGVHVHVTETITLTLNPDTKDWEGASSNEGENLYVSICSLEEADHYDVELTLRQGTDLVDSHTWHNVTIPPGRPFDTGALKHVLHETEWYYELHARG